MANPQNSTFDSFFVLPLTGKYILYSPLHDFAALLNRAAVAKARDHLTNEKHNRAEPLGQILSILRTEPAATPARKQGDLLPEFLGLIPTRACNLACVYCDFGATHEPQNMMSLELARAAVDWYLDLVCRSGKDKAEIHFFGGEPFCAPDVIDVAVYRAKARAKERGLFLRFEVATNGAFDERRCQWVADHLDTVVLSLDGPAEVHDHHRPCRGGQGSYALVARNALTLSEGPAELCLRACITRDTVDRMEEIADWFCRTFRPQSVCFETLQPTAQAQESGLYPPDPWEFARHYIRAAETLEAYGVEPIYATADIRARRISFCPVGRDVPIVSPDGMIAACYLLEGDWQARGLDMRMGWMAQNSAVTLDMDIVEALRDMNVSNRPTCDSCFCRWHCAGGCHVDHRLSGLPGAYDRLCIQTRSIALSNILKGMGQERLVEALLDDATALQTVVCQPSDRLLDWR
jgi:radical SAM protein with 4Fe4S-binding SPASM domain